VALMHSAAHGHHMRLPCAARGLSQGLLITIPDPEPLGVTTVDSVNDALEPSVHVGRSVQRRRQPRVGV
jgi:hypothetical protein